MLQFKQDDVKRIRSRVNQWPGVLEHLKKQCEFFFTDGIKVPVGTKSTWVMFFECPKDSHKLIYDYARESEYVCPVCGTVYTGEPYEGAWWRYTVDKTVNSAYLCAIVWLITGEQKYLDIAAKTLTLFADNFAGYTLHGGIPYNNPGRINSQTLCEALTLRALCMNYDIIRNALPVALQTHIENNLLLPSAQVLIEQRMNQLHNHEVVIDSALGIAGLLLQRIDMLEFGVESKYGLRYQLQHGVLSDGLWFEGTVHYHYFVLSACMLFEKFAHGTVYSLQNMGIYDKMFEMPLKIIQPDYHMPCLGDGSNEGMFEELAGYYEYPYRLFRKPYMAQILNKVYTSVKRNSIQALLYGADKIEPTPPMVLGNYHDTDASGITVLRGSNGKYLLFKHGKFGGEHDHYDKLGIHFLANDVEVADDLGTVGYGAPHHYPYFKNTFTHNTVCINGMNQPPADGKAVQYTKRTDGILVEGHVDWCGKEPALDSLTIEQWDTPSYAGVTMRRAILFNDDYFVEAFLVRGAKNRVVDWLNHAQGELITPVADYQPATVQVGGSKPQSFLYDSKSFTPHCVVETCWSQAAGRLRLFSACNVPSELIYAFGPNKPGHAPLGYVVHRVCPDTRDVVYMNVFAFGKAGEQITSVELSENAPGKIYAEIMLNGEIHTHRFSIGS